LWRRPQPRGRRITFVAEFTSWPFQNSPHRPRPSRDVRALGGLSFGTVPQGCTKDNKKAGVLDYLFFTLFCFVLYAADEAAPCIGSILAGGRYPSKPPSRSCGVSSSSIWAPQPGPINPGPLASACASNPSTGVPNAGRKHTRGISQKKERAADGSVGRGPSPLPRDAPS